MAAMKRGRERACPAVDAVASLGGQDSPSASWPATGSSPPATFREAGSRSISGQVRVSLTAPSGREVTLYRIGAGEACLLTTSSLIGDEPLPAEGFAETDVEARIVPKAIFERLIAEDPEFRRDVLRNYANRVADLVVTMQDVLFRAIPERLARGAPRARKRRRCRGDASGDRERTRQRARSREPNRCRSSSATA